jgi:hypothetical protein
MVLRRAAEGLKTAHAASLCDPDRLSDEHFTEAVQAAPEAALECVAGRLSDEQFAEAVRAAPEAALEFTSDRLSDEQFAEALQAAPEAALEFAADRLSDEQFVEAVASAPQTELDYWSRDRLREIAEDLKTAHAESLWFPDRLSDEQFAEAVRAAPEAALEFAADRLSDEQFDEAVRAAPEAALEYARRGALRGQSAGGLLWNPADDDYKLSPPRQPVLWKVLGWAIVIVFAGMTMRDCSNSYGTGNVRDCVNIGRGVELGTDC